MAVWTMVGVLQQSVFVCERLNQSLTTASQPDAGCAGRHVTPHGSLDATETTRLYSPCVDTLGRADLAPRAQPSQADRQDSQTGAAVSESLRRRRNCPESADCMLPCTPGEGGGGSSNTQTTAHAVTVRSQVMMGRTKLPIFFKS